MGNLGMVVETSGVGEMCRGDAITGDKLDGVEGMRGVGVSWIVSWGGCLFLKGDRRLDLLFYKIINGLAQVPFEGILVEAYKGTRRKHNMKFRQIGHTTTN